MSMMNCGKLFHKSIVTPLVQSLRHRTRKPNTRRPAIPHWHRAVTLAVTKPQYENKTANIHPAELCIKKEKMTTTKEVNPFEQILAREFFEKVEESKVLVVFHRYPMQVAELFNYRVELSKVGLYYHHTNNNIAKLAFTGTKYETLLPLYYSHTATFLGDEVKVAKLLKLQKKLRGLLLLAGVVDGRLMSVNELQQYVTLPSLPVLHSQLVGILNGPAQQLSQNLNCHQTELSESLARYISESEQPAIKEESIAETKDIKPIS